MDDQAPDWAGLYAEHAADVIALMLSLDEDALETVVPATPAWTVVDVLRHLAGGGTDAVTGRMDGAPSPDWSRRHVSERAGMGVGELVEELRGNVAPIGELVADQRRPALVWDIVVHHTDLHEALGLGRLNDARWRDVLDAAAGMMLGELPVTVVAGERSYGGGGPEVHVTPYELFRALFSRRSRTQVAAWADDVVTAEQVCLFGPREDDQPVPEP